MARIRKQFTRMVVDARKTAALTQDEAASNLGCSINTLQKNEADELHIHDDMALRMSMVHRGPQLKRWYCENECAIGCQEHHWNCERSSEELLLDLLLIESGEVPASVKGIRDIFADGVIGDAEAPALARRLDFLKQLQSNLNAVILQVEQAEARSGR